MITCYGVTGTAIRLDPLAEASGGIPTFLVIFIHDSVTNGAEHRADGIATITLNRPLTLNALNPEGTFPICEQRRNESDGRLKITTTLETFFVRWINGKMWL